MTPLSEVPMNNDASNGILIVAVVVAIAHSGPWLSTVPSNTPIRGDYDLPPLASGR